MPSKFLPGRREKEHTGSTIGALVRLSFSISCDDPRDKFSLPTQFRQLTLGASETNVPQGAHTHTTPVHNLYARHNAHSAYPPMTTDSPVIKQEQDTEDIALYEDESDEWPTIEQSLIIDPPKSRGKSGGTPQTRFDVYQPRKKLNETTPSPEEVFLFKQRVRPLELDDDHLRLVMIHSGNCFESQLQLVNKLEELKADGVVLSFWTHWSKPRPGSSNRKNAARVHGYQCNIEGCQSSSGSLQKACQHLTGHHWQLKLHRCRKCLKAWTYARNASNHEIVGVCWMGRPLLSKIRTSNTTPYTIHSTMSLPLTTPIVQAESPVPMEASPSAGSLNLQRGPHIPTVAHIEQPYMQFPDGAVCGNLYDVHRQPQIRQPQIPVPIHQSPNQWGTNPIQPSPGYTNPHTLTVPHPAQMNNYASYRHIPSVPVTSPPGVSGQLGFQCHQTPPNGHSSHASWLGPRNLQVPLFAYSAHGNFSGISGPLYQHSYPSQARTVNPSVPYPQRMHHPHTYMDHRHVAMAPHANSTLAHNIRLSHPTAAQGHELLKSPQGSGPASVSGSSVYPSTEYLPHVPDHTDHSGHQRFATRNATVEVAGLLCVVIRPCKDAGSFFIAPLQWRYQRLTSSNLAEHQQPSTISISLCNFSGINATTIRTLLQMNYVVKPSRKTNNILFNLSPHHSSRCNTLTDLGHYLVLLLHL